METEQEESIDVKVYCNSHFDIDISNYEMIYKINRLQDKVIINAYCPYCTSNVRVELK